MINNIANQSSFPAATIDSQMLLKMVNEARRLRGEKEVRNNDFIARIKDELEGEGYEIFVTPMDKKKGGADQVVIVMTYKQALRVAARESKAVRRSLVDKLESMQQQLQQKTTTKKSPDGLEEFRKARALKMTVDTMKDLFDFLPHLAPEAKQVVAASLINPVVGFSAIPLPVIDEHHYSASEVGTMLGISANKVGRIANTYMLKTEKYGKWFIDKSAHSDKQVETFRYNEAGVHKIEELIEGERKAA
ncbi:hypothetical protein KXR38_000965 [Escherichia coli]|uniref:Antirepressor protein n=9 Tax=root TaxID=1 RepID=A0A1E5MAA6_ECOLX|nr:hypothetical protein [Escherichia coli]YP_009907844.1 anti-repressor [Escherichia phage Lyz12581Vzw]EAC1773249.1 hypothetical protein [Salmonella enterica]ECS2477422.1 hypothetical protein [Salmonella enterica subsp. enterica serovar Heidelberg]ECW5601332.1 hypothetical protein [Salmonella enterica subsp. enterica serovar Kentucky]EEX3603561.1 hypothetical protein [Escherichia coli O157:H7]EEX5264516.1 hypothetical protein [Escherichia coli O157]EEZ6491353.1 hypothetical protein [Escheric